MFRNRSRVSETTDYDPRYDRAQSVEGAKARYVDDQLAYSLADMERDVARVLQEGANPDRQGRPILGGQEVIS